MNKHWTIYPLFFVWGEGKEKHSLRQSSLAIFMLPSKELGASFAPPRIPRCASSPSQGRSGPSPLGGHSRLLKHRCSLLLVFCFFYINYASISCFSWLSVIMYCNTYFAVIDMMMMMMMMMMIIMMMMQSFVMTPKGVCIDLYRR